MRDHYKSARDAIGRHNVKPMDEAAACAQEDQLYYAGMVDYRKRTANLLDPIWSKDIYD
jgi:hypothetical protein